MLNHQELHVCLFKNLTLLLLAVRQVLLVPLIEERDMWRLYVNQIAK